jgi:nucleoside-diphosphate-sugar epimerase
MKAKQKKAIITGATGGLGRNLGEFLLKKGWQVLGFGRNEEIGKTLNYNFKAFDLSNLDKCLDAFEEADVVFHCAAKSSPWGSYKSFYNDNVVATKNVINAMREYNIPKLVHVSTPSVYFDFKNQRNVKENFKPKKFVNNYAKTKYEAELVVLSSDLDVSIIRPRGIFGEYDTVLIPRLEKIAQKGFLPLIKDKDAIVDITYVGNVVYAMYLCATKKLPNKIIFNITNDEPLPISKIFKMVMKSLNKDVEYKYINYNVMITLATILEFVSKISFGKEPIITKYGVGLISYDQTLDLTQAKEILGYEPQYTIVEGLERYANSRD